MKNIFNAFELNALRRINVAHNDIENAIKNALSDGDARAIEVINPFGRKTYEIVYNDCLRDYAREFVEEINAKRGYYAEEVSVKIAMYNSKKLVKEYNK